MCIVVETERLIIREPMVEDFETKWKMKNDIEVSKFTGGIPEISREEAFEIHKEFCEGFKENDSKVYSIILKETDEYIGYCGFKHCELLGGIEILYGYDKKHWGKGYGLEAARRVFLHGIQDLGLTEIVAAVNEENVPSEKILQSLGMKFVEKVQWPKQEVVKKYAAHVNTEI